MKNIMKAAVLASLGFAGQLLATEFRAPVATTNGPLYYSFDKLHKKKSNFTMWTVGQMRESNEAFLKHGTDKHPLGSLFFGKETFTIGESFQDASASKWGLTENYSPFLDLTKLAPKVSYHERGVIWGASWDYPIWKNKGRIGVRASVPFKYIKIERDDQAEDAFLESQEHSIKQDFRFVPRFDVSNDPVTPKTLRNISSYRLKLLKNLMFINDKGNVLSVYRTDKNGEVTIGSSTYNKSNSYSDKPQAYGTGQSGTSIPLVLIESQKEGMPPYNKGGALLVDSNTKNGQPQNVCSDDTRILYNHSEKYAATPSADYVAVELLPLGTDGGIPTDRAAVFIKGTDYSKLDVDNNEDLWATTVNGMNEDTVTELSNTTVRNIDALLQRYPFNVVDWLQDRGFQMQSNEDTSFGDISAEVFYEHCFNDSWRGELELGVKFPTGNGGNDYGNPIHNAYRVQTGNGSHWEIKLGGLVAWQTFDWMNIKLDAAVNFAIEDTEERCASYKGAHVKNLGIRADAETDWVSFVGNLDFNFTHPKTKKLKGMIGYQFYYKTEDHVDFKNSKAKSWLGKVWGSDVNTPATSPDVANPVQGTDWYDLNMQLDGHVAEMNTEQIAHRLRLEGAYSLSKYITVAVGSLYTFAGQNIPSETDVHAGFNVRF